MRVVSGGVIRGGGLGVGGVQAGVLILFCVALSLHGAMNICFPNLGSSHLPVN